MKYSDQPKKSILKTCQAVPGLSIFEGLLVLLYFFKVPADSKYRLFFGYSLSRWSMIFFCLVVLLILTGFFFSKKRINRILDWLHSFKVNQTILACFIFVLFSGILFLILYPQIRFAVLSLYLVRLWPILLWLTLILFQSALFILFVQYPEVFSVKPVFTKKHLLYFGLAFFLILLFYLLRLLGVDRAPGDGISTVGNVLLQSQVFLVWFVAVLFFMAGNLKKITFSDRIQRAVPVIIPVFLWGAAFLLYRATPITCVNDLASAVSPNYKCYPEIGDAVYTVGSHYISLGQGIYNHWPTDKPFYMVFLALGQLLFGTSPDAYLTIQIAALAFLPVLIYGLTRKLVKDHWAVAIAGLYIVLEINNIRFYEWAGSPNAKLEMTENLLALFTALFLYFYLTWSVSLRKKTSCLLWTGLLIGCSVLIRFNAVIFFFMILFLLLIQNRTCSKKICIQNILVYLLAFCMAVVPWFFSAHDAQGNNFYWVKIRQVIDSRSSSDSQTLWDTAITDYSRRNIGLLKAVPKAAFPEGKKPDSGSVIRQVGVHTLNSLYSSVFIFPTTMQLQEARKVISQPYLNRMEIYPIWLKNFSLENQIMFMINGLLLLWGVIFAIQKWGWQGCIPLLVQLGTYLAHALAFTSGGRYISSVNWISVFYFGLGVVAIINGLLRKAGFPDQLAPAIPDSHACDSRPESKRSFGVHVCLVLLVAGLVPVSNAFSDTQRMMPDAEALNTARVILQEQGKFSEDSWNRFIQQPDHVVQFGYGYQPRYSRDTAYYPGNLSSELLMLNKDHVLLSYMQWKAYPSAFQDGSQVIVVGCKLRQYSYWSAPAMDVQAYAILQLDHEKNLLLEDGQDWVCP